MLARLQPVERVHQRKRARHHDVAVRALSGHRHAVFTNHAAHFAECVRAAGDRLHRIPLQRGIYRRDFVDRLVARIDHPVAFALGRALFSLHAQCDFRMRCALARRSDLQLDQLEMKVGSSSKSTPHAEVTLRVEGKECSAEGEGDGMVDACYKAIYKIAAINPALERYAVKAITGGTDALGEVSCMIRENGVTVAERVGAAGYGLDR